MKLAILAVGHRLPDWVAEGCTEYVKRMPRELAVSVVEIKPEPRGSKTREQLTGAEKARIRAALPTIRHLLGQNAVHAGMAGRTSAVYVNPCGFVRRSAADKE